MDTILLPSPKPFMVAHRGVSGLECENTCPSFLFAASRSHSGIETDVHVTLDGAYVLCHDSALSRVAPGCDLVIESSTLSDLLAVQLTSPRTHDTRSDYRIPLFSDYLRICKKYGKTAVLEIKTDFSAPEIEGLLSIAKAEEYLSGIVFISFHKGALLRLREAFPSAPVQFLTDAANDETLAFLDENGMDLDLHERSLTKEYLDLVHAHGHKVNVWTVDDPARAALLSEWGVDYITSNILE